MKTREILNLIAHLKAQAEMAKTALNASLDDLKRNADGEPKMAQIESNLHKLSEIQRRLSQAEKAYRRTLPALCAK